jgi:hypothetical protein
MQLVFISKICYIGVEIWMSSLSRVSLKLTVFLSVLAIKTCGKRSSIALFSLAHPLSSDGLHKIIGKFG